MKQYAGRTKHICGPRVDIPFTKPLDRVTQCRHLTHVHAALLPVLLMRYIQLFAKTVLITNVSFTSAYSHRSSFPVVSSRRNSLLEGKDLQIILLRKQASSCFQMTLSRCIFATFISMHKLDMNYSNRVPNSQE